MASKNYDSPLYFRAAREAAQIERDGDYHRAAKVWNKAHRLSRNHKNKRWSEDRSDFCLTWGARELKELNNDNASIQ